MQKVKCPHCQGEFNADTARLHKEQGEPSKIRCAWCAEEIEDPGPDVDADPEVQRARIEPGGTAYVVQLRAVTTGFVDNWLSTSMQWSHSLSKSVTVATEQEATQLLQDAPNPPSSSDYRPAEVRAVRVLADNKFMLLPDAVQSGIFEVQPVVYFDVRVGVRPTRDASDAELLKLLQTELPREVNVGDIAVAMGGVVWVEQIQLAPKETSDSADCDEPAEAQPLEPVPEQPEMSEKSPEGENTNDETD